MRITKAQHDDFKRQVRILAGALLAVVAGWLLITFEIWISVLIFDLLPLSNSFLHIALIVAWVANLLAAVPAIGFVAGLICAFFWRPVALAEQQKNWGCNVLFWFVLPFLFGGPCA